MAERTKEYLKGRFEDGDVPTGTDFADLIDTMLTTAQGDAKYVAPSALSWVKNLGDFDTEAAGDAATLEACRTDNNSRVRLMLYRFKGPTPSGIQMYHSRVVLNAFYATTYSSGATARFDVVQYKFGTDSEGVQSRYVQQANSSSPVVTKAWHRITLNASELSTVGGYSVVNGVMNMGHFDNLDAALTTAARADISGARGVGVLSFTYQGAAGKCSAFIYQTIKGDDVAVQYIFDRGAVKVRCVTGATGGTNGTMVVNDEATWAHRIVWSGNDIQLRGYETHGGSAPVLSTVSGVAKTSQLPTAATPSKAGLMSAEQYSKLTALPTNDELTQQIDAAETAAFDSLWTSAGGTIDRSGHASAPYLAFEGATVYLNYTQAREVYTSCEGRIRSVSGNFVGAFAYSTGTTDNILPAVLPINIAQTMQHFSMANAFQSQTKLKEIKLSFTSATPQNRCHVTSLYFTFFACIALERVIGTIYLSPNFAGHTRYDFENCTNLTEIRLHGLSKDITFYTCSKLSLASLQYLVTNASSSIPASAPITVTVHADVYAKLTDAEQAEWHAVLTAAAAKNIAFASA